MKYIHLAIIAVLSVTAAHAAQQLKGSDTLERVMKDSIEVAKVGHLLEYVGGGSGKGEEALIAGTQGVTAMSREASADAIAKAQAKGITLLPHSIGIDGVAILVNTKNGLKRIDFSALRDIFTCQITHWEDVPGSDQWGDIVVYRRDDASGTTDAVKNLLGIKQMGNCAKVVNTANEIASHTANESNSIGYGGLPTVIPSKNRPLALAKLKNDKAVEPTKETIRNRTYPLSRFLYVYEVGGKGVQTSQEQELMRTLVDRKIMDPIIEKHEFYTIP